MVAELWRTTDRLGREIVLTDSGWLHVLVGHPEMIGCEGDVRAAVGEADFINRDADHAHRENHYRVVAGRVHLKVCVEYAATPEVVITAHVSQRIKRRERRRWP